MTSSIIRRAALAAAGAFILSATPIQSASIDPTVAFDGGEEMLRPTGIAPAMMAPMVEKLPAVASDVPDHFEVSLDPGEFVWEPERAPTGSVEIVVSIPLQRIYVYRAGTLIGVSTVSTGRRGHETPAGTFNILQKRREHYSNLYNNAPMPFMQRLTWDGIALHAGQIPGRPASHGCVRLPLAFARHLFGVTEMGAAVHILQQSPAAGEALAMVRNNGLYQGMGGPIDE